MTKGLSSFEGRMQSGKAGKQAFKFTANYSLLLKSMKHHLNKFYDKRNLTLELAAKKIQT